MEISSRATARRSPRPDWLKVRLPNSAGYFRLRALVAGGASVFAETVRQLRARVPGTRIELLVPDFQGDRDALAAVVAAGPDVLAHNIETVPRLYRTARAGSRYARSLDLLERARGFGVEIVTKSSLMLGLGERRDEVIEVLGD